MGIVAERRNALDKLNTLLVTRTETLALYNQLVELRPFDGQPASDVELVLREFSETLVDYTASAHFQLYRFIEEGTERRTAVVDMANEVYPDIAATTQGFLNFNDKYDDGHFDRGLDVSSLDDDLSKIGEMLADRIQWEDRIIAAFQLKD